ncbi:MAG: type II secretion system F family protein [Alphaproteobacteria bacterium]|nr:type II secretion system F family protein [Alphaproteobacteria bacterium]
MQDEQLIVIISAVAAAASFAAFALPFLNKSEKKQHYRDVISKKRKDLFNATKDGTSNINADHANKTKESLAMFFKIQKMFGKFGEKLRDQMLQAGIRDPKAPMYFLLGRIILPIFLAGYGLLMFNKIENEFESTQILAIILALAAAGFFLPSILVKNHIQKRQIEINLNFPDALDMLLICVQGGIGLEQAIDRIAEEVTELSETLAEELGILSAEMGLLNDRRTALQDFARRVGSGAAKSFATAMIQADQYGTSVTNAMNIISEDLRDQRMQEAERKAASLPPKLTVPMIVFFLPGLFYIILGPLYLKFKYGG